MIAAVRRGPVRGPSHPCNRCDQRHRRHDSVVSVQVAHRERRAAVLIIRRSWVRAPPAPPAFSMSGQRWPWTDVGGAVTSYRRHAEHPIRSRRATAERVLVGGAHGQSAIRNIHSILSRAIDAAQRWQTRPSGPSLPPPAVRPSWLPRPSGSCAAGNRNLRPPDCDDITVIKFTDVTTARMEAGDSEPATLLAHWVSHGQVLCDRR